MDEAYGFKLSVNVNKNSRSQMLNEYKKSRRSSKQGPYLIMISISLSKVSNLHSKI